MSTKKPATKNVLMSKMSRILRVRKRGAVWARNSVPQMILTMRFCGLRILFKLDGYVEHHAMLR